MSVLNFPRIYFNGHMFWNPPTANNNDVFPLYDAVNMRMNWDFLRDFNINDANASSKLLPWMITALKYEQVPDYVLQVPGNGSRQGYPMIPAEWDLFGDNSCGTVDYNSTKSVVIGGEFKANDYISSDSLINQGYQFYGNPFGGSTPTPARFVDVSPWQNTFTALYFDNLKIGTDTCGLELTRKYRMLDRFLNFNWGAFGGLNYVTTTWQTCFPQESIKWALGNSALLQTLQDQMKQQNALGLMFRFTTYLTFYDLNGILNNFKPVDSHSKSDAALAAMREMYDKGLHNTNEIFFNPAYSRTAGTLGLWLANEYPTAPAGLRLAPSAPVPFYKAVPGDSIIYPPTREQTVTLGVISAQANGDVLSLDLGNTFPFFPVGDDPQVPPPVVQANKGVPVAGKFNVGAYDVVYRTTDSPTPVTLASFGFDQYRQSEYDKRAGLLDLPLSPQAQEQLKQEGRLELQLQGSDPLVIAAAQQTWTAEVIDSGSFINVGDPQPLTLKIMVQCNGKPAPKGTKLRVAEYNNAFMLTTSSYYLGFTNDVDFTLINDYPDDRSLNTPNLPQFVDAQAIANLLYRGSGRRLQALSEVESSDQEVSITYKEFLEKPASVSLKACLQLIGGQPQHGILQDTSNAEVDYSVALIETDEQGVAQISVKGIAPGFPTLRFYFGDEPVSFSFNVNDAYIDFLAPIRVLPQEQDLVREFVSTWNQMYQYQDSNVRIWNAFIFPKILRPFYYLYPIMNKFMPLDSLQRIEGAIEQFTRLISREYQDESTLAMPITRDLPQSRRQVLEIWANQLVKQGYPPEELDIKDYL